MFDAQVIHPTSVYGVALSCAKFFSNQDPLHLEEAPTKNLNPPKNTDLLSQREAEHVHPALTDKVNPSSGTVAWLG